MELSPNQIPTLEQKLEFAQEEILDKDKVIEELDRRIIRLVSQLEEAGCVIHDPLTSYLTVENPLLDSYRKRILAAESYVKANIKEPFMANRLIEILDDE